MSKIALEGNASGTGTFTIAGPNTNTNYTITLPQETGTLFTTGATTGLNASALSTGTTAVNVGGTGASTLTAENVVIGNGTSAVKFVAPGTTGNVLTSNGSAWVSQAAAAGGGDYVMLAYTSPATWTKPAGLKAVKVTVVGAGGNGAAPAASPAQKGFGSGGGGGGGTAILYIDAPGVPGPVAVTAGPGTNSFGAFASATAGSAGSSGSVAPAAGPTPRGGGGAGGAGSSGTVNITGGGGGVGDILGGNGGSSTLGGGGSGGTIRVNLGFPGFAGGVYGGGGGGGAYKEGDPCAPVPNPPGGAGAAGIVIVEEFY